ncbi:MAG: hypothetical protein OHK0040_08020 [bacterium]
MKVKKWDIVFVIVVAAVVLFFSLAPKQTTPRVPFDDVHKELKDEKKCRECHGAGTQMPLPEKHPNKERCLLCHKRK